VDLSDFTNTANCFQPNCPAYTQHKVKAFKARCTNKLNRTCTFSTDILTVYFVS